MNLKKLVIEKFLTNNIKEPVKEIDRNIKNILIVRLDEIGDNVLNIPFIRELRRNYPDADITLVVKPQVYNLMELCPYVDRVSKFKKIGIKYGFLLNLLKIYFFCKKLNRDFDLAILPRWDIDNYYASFIIFFSKARNRLAFSEKVNKGKSVINKGYDKLFTKVFDYRKYCHEVEKNLYLLKQLGGTITDDSLELWNDTDDEKYIDHLLKNYEKEYLIALVVSASSNKKEWAPENFCSLMTKIIKYNKNVKFVLLGDKKNTEKIKNKIVHNFLPSYIIDCVGKTTLRQTFTILKRCNFFIGLDTGPMHIASCCNISGIVLYCDCIGQNETYKSIPLRFGPWKSKLKVIRPFKYLGDCKEGCTKNYAHCINQITVEQVFEEYRKLQEGKL